MTNLKANIVKVTDDIRMLGKLILLRYKQVHKAQDNNREVILIGCIAKNLLFLVLKAQQQH